MTAWFSFSPSQLATLNCHEAHYLLHCCSVAVLERHSPSHKNTSIFIYKYRVQFWLLQNQFWNCNTATRELSFPESVDPPNCGQECHDQMTLMTHHDRSHFLKSINSVFIFRESHYTGSCHTLSFLMYAQGVLSVKNSVICMNFSTLAKEAGKHIRPFLVHIRSSFSKI